MQKNVKCLCMSEHVQFLHFNLGKRGTTKCKFSAWKVIIPEMECKSGCHERKNLHQFNGHLQHWTEAETKSDSQVESLINVAEVKANFMGKLHYY